MNWKTTESWSRGQMIEELFGELLAHRDPDYRRSTRKEQFAHIDYHSSLGTFDVKARKRMSRSPRNYKTSLLGWSSVMSVGILAGCAAGPTQLHLRESMTSS